MSSVTPIYNSAGGGMASSNPIFSSVSLLLPVSQAISSLILLSLGAGWLLASRVRSRAAKDERGARNKILSQTNADSLPKVSVVLPVKGLSETSEQNWSSQLLSDYPGPLEFIFVNEAPDSPSRPVFSNLFDEIRRRSMSLRVVTAGRAEFCSQKIFNQLAGMRNMSSDSKYVLFLDDDVQLRPTTISAFVYEMESRKDVFILTGYPFDIPSKSSFFSYCALSHHLPLAIGFSTGGRTSFVWGGCMMMRAKDFRKNKHGLVTALEKGGYSDDMTLAAVASANGRTVWVPSYAVLEQQMGREWSLSKYWNYHRRQIYVLFTYSSRFNKMLNIGLLIVHSFLSWSLVLPAILSIRQAVGAVGCSFLMRSGVPVSTCTQGDYKVTLLTAAHALSLLFAAASLRVFLRTSLAATVPSGEKPPFKFHHSLPPFSGWKLWLGIFVFNFVHPLCVLYTLLTPHIEWSGTYYMRYDGRVRVA